MNALLKALALTAAWLVSSAALAGEAVPVNATFGIQWTADDWSDPTARTTETYGAAGLPNGQVLAIYTYDSLDAVGGTIQGYGILWFSYDDGVVVEYSGPAGYDPETNTASFRASMTVVDGWGRFAGATGSLTNTSRILFGPAVGTFQIKGVIKTAN
jgi:hypothetical protein